MRYHKVQVYFLTALLIGALALTLLMFLPYFGALFLGAAFAIIFQPLYLWLLRHISKVVRIRQGELARIIAATISLVLLVILILVPFFIIGIQIFGEVRQLYATTTQQDAFNSFDATLNQIQDRFGIFLPNFSTNVNEYIAQALQWLSQHIGILFSSLGRVFLALFLSLLAFYYLVKDGAALRDFYIRVSPLPEQDDERILVKLQAAVTSVVRGRLVVAVIQGFLAGIGFVLFGLPNPTLWGSVTAIAALVPTFGTSLILIPAVLYLLLSGATGPAIGLAIWGILVVGLLDNMLAPQVMKQGVAVHPFVILLSVLGGLSLFGPIGFLIGPVIISLLLALLEIYIEIVEPIKHPR